MSRLEITMKASFRSSHELKVDSKIGDPELRDICDIVHGHEYFLEATYSALIDPTTGVSLSRDLVLRDLHDNIVARLHNKKLNSVLRYTSGEEIAKWCFDELKKAPQGKRLTRVSLIETKKNRFYYPEIR